MQLREYRPSDAAALATIFYRSVREVGSRCYSQAQAEAWAPGLAEPSVGHSGATAEGPITIVAVDEDDPFRWASTAFAVGPAAATAAFSFSADTPNFFVQYFTS
jgi:hypothetical protein